MATITLRSNPTNAVSTGATVKGSPLSVLQVDDNFNNINAALLQTVTINGTAVSLGGTISVTANTTNALTAGSGLSTTGTFNGSAARTFSIDDTVVATLGSIQTFTGAKTFGASGSFGGGFTLQKPATGTTLTNDVRIDVSGDEIRLYQISSGFGATLDVSAGGTITSTKFVTSSNIGTYAPSLTGTGATGTWNITAAAVTGGVYTSGNQTIGGVKTFSEVIQGSISGNAGTVTNGVTLNGAQTLTQKTISGSNNTITNIGNSSLTNSSVTINGTAISLGGSATVTANTTNALTAGSGLTSTGTFNGSTARTFTVDSTVVRTNLGSTSLQTISGFTQFTGTMIDNNHFMTIAVSDETTAITTGTAKITFRAPYAMTLFTVPRASLSTASSSGNPTVDINVNGTTIFGTQKLYIPQGLKTSKDASGQATLSTTSVADDDEVTIDIDTAGTGAKGLKVILYYRRTNTVL